MSNKPTPNRHGILFEMLRHQTLSDVTSKRVDNKDRTSEAQINADAFLKRALYSWDQMQPAPVSHKPSTAKPGRNYEFFGAVRA